MSFNNEKLLNFKKAILEEANEEILKIKQNIKQHEKEELETAKQKESERILKYTQERIKSLKIKNEQELAKKSFELKNEVLKYRKKLVEELVVKCEKKLADFANSDKYDDYFIEKFEKSMKSVGFEVTDVEIRPEDKKFEEYILKLNPNIKINIDSSNKLGGFKFLNKEKGLVLDRTVYSALLESRKYFFKNSLLTLKNY